MTSNLAGALAGLALIVSACAGQRCPVTASDRGLLLKIDHFSGGDAPIVHSLEVYESGVLRLNKVGFAVSCSEASVDEVDELRSLLAAAQVEKIESDPRAGMGWEMAQVLVGDSETRIVLEDPPEALTPVFDSVDDLFRSRFGRRYDMPLLTSD